MTWETKTQYSQEEFQKLTEYCNRSDNSKDNRNRAIALGILSENVLVAPGAIIRLQDSSSIGKNTFIGLYSYINGQITIGENVLIGPHCSITSNNHVFNPATQSFQGKNESAPIHISDGSWLAAGVMITAGVRLGKANLISANAVVTHSTEDYAIMAGTPAKCIGKINPQTGQYDWFKKGNI